MSTAQAQGIAGRRFLAGTAAGAAAFGTGIAVCSLFEWANASPIYKSGDQKKTSKRL
jgi:hypothetical protein